VKVINAKPIAKPHHKILVVDDHPVVREALTLRIGREPDLIVCGAVSAPREAMAFIEKLEPELVILDLSMAEGHGLELTAEIHDKFPSIRLLVFSMHDESLYGERALRSGAHGYVMKDEEPDQLVTAVRRVLAGEVAISPRLAGIMLKSIPREGRSVGLAKLSDRELEIFRMIGSGLATKEIAARLHRGIKTIETHRLRMKEKLSIATNAELIAKAASWLATSSTKDQAN